VTTPSVSRPHTRWKRAALAVGITFALLLGIAGVGGYLIYRHLDSNLTVDNSADNELGSGPLPTGSGTQASRTYQAENILVMGSDTRVGQHGEGGSAKVYSTAQSDVVMLVHLSADRRHAMVMSIPRDTWVTLPMCKDRKTGIMRGGFQGKFNEAFTIGGPACTIKLVKQVTGLPIDHFVVVDFNGVKEIIDALGGIQFCLKTALHDPIENGHGSGLDLPAGRQVVSGDQGLAFLRARYNVGDGSDISRLDRQHAFLGAMIKQVQSTSLLTNPKRLYDILDAATRSITTDTGLGSLFKLKDLAQSLTSLKPANVTFFTIPWKSRGDGANVLIDEAAARAPLRAIADDTQWPPKPKPKPTATPTTTPLKTPPQDVSVKVLNASGTVGQGTKAADALRAQGFHVVSVTTAPTTSATTVVHYSASRDESARTLMAAVTGSQGVVDGSLSQTLVLYVGADYAGVVPVSVPTATPTPTPSLPSTAAVMNAGTGGCY
jgi:LCP family protein required for cell wall assembly